MMLLNSSASVRTGFRKLLYPALCLSTGLATIQNPLAEEPTSQPLKALSIHGDAKYDFPGDQFKHFDYVNPHAPKGGLVRMAGNGTFDSLNPYIARGTAATGIEMIYDTLMTQSRDEPFSLYPLVALSAEIARDNSSIAFNLNPAAHFHDGTPVTAADVKFTFDTLIEQGHPHFRSYYADVEKVEATGSHRVVFQFKHNKNKELPFILAELPVMPKHYWSKPEHDFAAANLNIPLGSGPYQIESVDGGRSISFSRVEDYWGKDLPVNVGRYNFNQVRYDYYRDENVSLQAFTAGQYDFRLEYIAKNWATAYDVPAVHNGSIILENIATRSPEPIQGFVFNTRHAPFDDRNVREALSYTMDFEWLNRTLFYSAYQRSKSYFNNSGMEATGIPTGDELALLEPYRKQLPPELFTQPFTVPETDGTGNIRPQLQLALQLLEKAGWTLDRGRLTNAAGEQMKMELLLAQPSFERVALPLRQNISTLGIDLNIRTVDTSQYINRIRNFDFDMIVTGYGQSASPGNEQKGYWGSQSADMPGSRNYIGIKDPVVDAMIEEVIDASSREELVTAVRALDRVLLWGHYLIPQWYSPHMRAAYSSRIKHPQSESLYSLDLYSWWMEKTPVATTNHQETEIATSETKPGSSKLITLAGGALALLALLWFQRQRKQKRQS